MTWGAFNTFLRGEPRDGGAGRLQFENVAYEKGRGEFWRLFPPLFSPNGGAKRNVTTPSLPFSLFFPILPPFFQSGNKFNFIYKCETAGGVPTCISFFPLCIFVVDLLSFFPRHLHAARSVSVLPFLGMGGRKRRRVRRGISIWHSWETAINRGGARRRRGETARNLPYIIILHSGHAQPIPPSLIYSPPGGIFEKVRGSGRKVLLGGIAN